MTISCRFNKYQALVFQKKRVYIILSLCSNKNQVSDNGIFLVKQLCTVGPAGNGNFCIIHFTP